MTGFAATINTFSYLICAKQHNLDVELVARGAKKQDLDGSSTRSKKGKYIYIYVCIYIYIWNKCMYVCMYGWVGGWMDVCMYMYMYVYVCKCMYMYAYVCICMYMYVYVCIYICICIYIYVYMYIWGCIKIRVWIRPRCLRFSMEQGYGSAYGFRVCIRALHFDSQPYIYMYIYIYVYVYDWDETGPPWLLFSNLGFAWGGGIILLTSLLGSAI